MTMPLIVIATDRPATTTTILCGWTGATGKIRAATV
jgi:hypothetical protein